MFLDKKLRLWAVGVGVVCYRDFIFIGDLFRVVIIFSFLRIIFVVRGE